MVNLKEWRFPSNGGGLGLGFNDAAVDGFAGRKISSLVREIIQNSLDAKDRNLDEPVRVKFALSSVPSEECAEVRNLKRHLSACHDTVIEQKLDDPAKFYDAAISRINNEPEIPFLAIHDANTTGLVGDPLGPTGQWYALVKGTGISQKSSGALGSFGHGSKAPFMVGGLRTLFYLSYSKSLDGSIERRFQGKSILQTHSDPDTREDTQGTGFYGWSANCSPLIDEDIPAWAISLRNEFTSSAGTSILIPFPSGITKDELPEIAISLIANFFYAFEQGRLEVEIGEDEKLTRASINEAYTKYKELLKIEQDEIDADLTQQNFDNLASVIEPMEEGTQQVPHLDTFKWYLRFDETMTKTRVAIARKDGMFVVFNPDKLRRFQLTKPFEMFVCIDGDKCSDVLRKLENPRHDNFEFDRILDDEEREKTEKDYTRIMKKIREIVTRHVGYTAEDEVSDDTFSDLFTEISTAETAEGNPDRARALVIHQGELDFKKANKSGTKFGDTTVGEVPGGGNRGGKGKKRTTGGPIPGRGKSTVIGPANPTNSGGKKPIILENLRVLSEEIEGAEHILLNVNFDNPGAGKYNLTVKYVGEDTTENIKILGSDGQPAEAWSVEFDDVGRQSVALTAPRRAATRAISAQVTAHEEDN